VKFIIISERFIPCATDNTIDQYQSLPFYVILWHFSAVDIGMMMMIMTMITVICFLRSL
jgi:hypothetical protein